MHVKLISSLQRRITSRLLRWWVKIICNRHLWKWIWMLLGCVWLCDPTDCSLPGSFVHGILQARTLGWVAAPFCRASSQPREWAQIYHIAGRFFSIWATREDFCKTDYVVLLDPEIVRKLVVRTTLYELFCNPMDCSPLGSSVHGISQARILEWVAIPFSRGSFWHRDCTPITCVSCIAGRFFTSVPPEKPVYFYIDTCLNAPRHFHSVPPTTHSKHTSTWHVNAYTTYFKMLPLTVMKCKQINLICRFFSLQRTQYTWIWEHLSTIE